MKKFIIFLTILSLSSVSFLFSRDITPVFSIRYDDLTDGVAVSDAIGLEMNLGNGRFTGFDTDGNDYRIYMGWGFGKIGFGHDGSNNNEGEYTVGVTYDLLGSGINSNVSMDVDYVFGDTDENLRLGIQIRFP